MKNILKIKSKKILQLIFLLIYVSSLSPFKNSIAYGSDTNIAAPAQAAGGADNFFQFLPLLGGGNLPLMIGSILGRLFSNERHKVLVTVSITLMGVAANFLYNSEFIKNWLKFETAQQSYFFKVDPKNCLEKTKLIYNSGTQSQIDSVFDNHEIAFVRANGLTFSNVLFYGDPGTGKTAIGESFALEGFDVYKVESRFLTIENVFAQMSLWIEKEYDKTKRPIVILVEEAEFLFKALTKSDTLKSNYLTYWGSESHKFFIVGTTNKVGDLFSLPDQYIRRFKIRIQVDLPDCVTRIALFKKYLEESVGLFAKHTKQDLMVNLNLDPDEECKEEKKDDTTSFYKATENLSPDTIKAISYEIASKVSRAKQQVDLPLLLGLLETVRKNFDWIESRIEKEYKENVNLLQRQAQLAKLEKEIFDSASPPKDVKKPL